MKELEANTTKELLQKLQAELLPGQAEIPVLSSLAYDSRQVKSGAAFFCIPGEKTDGNEYIPAAIAAGAKLIVSTRKHEDLSIPQMLVPDVRLALAEFADAFYRQPSRHLRLLGVTGTNGKTTTTHLIEQILGKSGKKTGLIGTLGSRIYGQDAYFEAKHTTPQAPELQALLAGMLENGCTHVAMEVSSHALALKRVAGAQFAVACLSNISQDHLDFHKTMENYWKAKRILFDSLNESCQENKLALVNSDDKLSGRFLENLHPSVKTLTYGFDQSAGLHVLDLSYSGGRSNLKLSSPWGQINLSMRLIGRFNVYNVMAASAICLSEGVEIKQLQDTLSDFQGVPGRFESVISPHLSSQPLCIVDYAHTPDGLDNVLKTAAGLKKSGGKLICVFGCGGDRDPSKRPQMGEIAEARCDLVIVSSDNPRTEDPQEIIANILTGIKKIRSVIVEPDRAKAIALAVEQASDEDIVLVAGKGHENYQLIKDQVLDFDDKIELLKALETRSKLKAVGGA